jgi:hypothetical protein
MVIQLKAPSTIVINPFVTAPSSPTEYGSGNSMINPVQLRPLGLHGLSVAVDWWQQLHIQDDDSAATYLMSCACMDFRVSRAFPLVSSW